MQNICNVPSNTPIIGKMHSWFLSWRMDALYNTYEEKNNRNETKPASSESLIIINHSEESGLQIARPTLKLVRIYHSFNTLNYSNLYDLCYSTKRKPKKLTYCNDAWGASYSCPPETRHLGYSLLASQHSAALVVNSELSLFCLFVPGALEQTSLRNAHIHDFPPSKQHEHWSHVKGGHLPVKLFSHSPSFNIHFCKL